MPLPPTLLARLKKRGLIKQDDSGDPDEEIIAEDYSDMNPAFYPRSSSQHGGDNDDDDGGDEEMEGGCPNKWNKWHTCSKYCEERWGKPRKKQPSNKSGGEELPPGWVKITDDNTGHPYYWNTVTDQVSWLDPTDPEAQITLPATILQTMENKGSSDSEDVTNGGSVEEEDLPPPGTEAVLHETCWKCGKKIKNVSGVCRTCELADMAGGGPMREKNKNVRKQGPPYQKKAQRADSEELDPMDPSAYSDTPRGGWTSGLVMQGEAKTGVDTTANGPLFQQRPYPSPGEILRQNKAAKS
ncbi:polyglutamine-binding protein 1-like isoform X2 [Glandiceps talaboti]